MIVREHGGGIDAAIRKYGGVREDWLDLSTGINPNSYPVKDIPVDVWQRLPDSGDETLLIEAATAYYRVSKDNSIVAAPGTQALIQVLPYLFEAASVGIFSPTYNEHAGCWNQAGHKVDEVETFGQLANYEVAIVVNPNNPTGHMFAPTELIKLSNKVGTLIVDEAFCDVLPENSLVPHCPEGSIILRSFGKFFGLAGLRLGFAICAPDQGKQLKSRLGPWAVSGPALEVGTKALTDTRWQIEMRENLTKAAEIQREVLARYDIKITGNLPLFLEVCVEFAEELFEHLASKNILVRKFSARPEYLRFGICGDKIALQKLDQALSSFRG